MRVNTSERYGTSTARSPGPRRRNTWAGRSV
jgi:hypothetical protein